MHRFSFLSHEMILTANNRLAMTIQQQCPENVVLSFNQWLQSLLPSSHLLTEYQQSALWESLVARSNPETFIHVDHTAMHAQQAMKLLTYWQLKECFAPTENKDHQFFNIWREQYFQRSQKEGWQGPYQVAENVLQQLIAGKIKNLPPRIIFVGFITPTPLESAIENALRTQGIEVQHFQAPRMKTKIARHAFQTSKEELQAMASWAKKAFESGSATQIACVIPDLSARRAEVARLFLNVLRDETLFNMSASPVLTSAPLIAHALLGLSLNATEIVYEEWSLLLRSPFIVGAETELIARTVLDVTLRQRNLRHLTLKNLITYTASCPLLQSALMRFQAASATSVKQGSAAWAKVFQQQYEALGWPGERTLNSDEFQWAAQWPILLAHFESLDRLLPSLSFHEAHTQLTRLSHKIVFQPQSAPAPIQVLGVLEASGLLFDAIWICGMHDAAWPSPPAPNPFIPLDLQKRYGFPHADSAQELQYAQRILQSFYHSAPQVILSYPLSESDRKLNPSPLITGFPEITVFALLKENKISKSVPWKCQKEEILIGPALPEGQSVAGGTRVLKDQALCPFRAFALHRLGARSLRTTTLGYDALERGQVVHYALEYLWKQLQNHAVLHTQDEAQLRSLIRESVKEALMKLKKLFSVEGVFPTLEMQRLETLLLKWLSLEKARMPFTVEATEHRCEFQLGGLRFHVQIDRIDRLDSGEKIIIDYKTNAPSLQAWFDDRPEEPQLPLYCLTLEEPVAGVLFAQVRANELRFKGITLPENCVPDVKTWEKMNFPHTWSEQVSRWRSILERLAQDFRSGIATIDPKNPPQTCNSCELGMLCRFRLS